jgi:hypothetical protein
MHITFPTFRFMPRTLLDKFDHCRAAIERPHAPRISGRQTTRQPAFLFASILFVAEHCPLLVTFHFEIPDQYSSYLRPKPTPIGFRPLGTALQKLVQQCPNLDLVGLSTMVTFVHVSTNGNIINATDRSQNKHHVELRLAAIPRQSREDAVRHWCRTTVKESIEYSEVIHYCDMGVIDWARYEPCAVAHPGY